MNTPSSPREKDPSGQSSGSPRFLIRPVEQQDLSEIAGILAKSFHLQPEFMRWLIPVMRMGIYEDLRNRLKSAPPHYSCLVALDQDDLIGTVEVGLRSFNPWQPRTSQYAYLSNLAVRSECRRKGAAMQLLEACDRVVLSWGFEDIYLHVLENNQSAKHLYEKSGYRLQDTDAGLTTWLLGQPRRLFLHKRLASISKANILTNQ
ncbi:GNAT family N-acetyltransferase [Phormidesmis priestleyi]|uniref:GNAT family N-acetyltransferase n=1 Tax=Phormidesmis priestleyi TaxID=268141 RepID=UPI0009F93541|nr:GNAT family N-acetyltransferase [Phormidesmis priestleyi]